MHVAVVLVLVEAVHPKLGIGQLLQDVHDVGLGGGRLVHQHVVALAGLGGLYLGPDNAGHQRGARGQSGPQGQVEEGGDGIDEEEVVVEEVLHFELHKNHVNSV